MWRFNLCPSRRYLDRTAGTVHPETSSVLRHLWLPGLSNRPEEQGDQEGHAQWTCGLCFYQQRCAGGVCVPGHHWHGEPTRASWLDKVTDGIKHLWTPWYGFVTVVQMPPPPHPPPHPPTATHSVLMTHEQHLAHTSHYYSIVSSDSLYTAHHGWRPVSNPWNLTGNDLSHWIWFRETLALGRWKAVFSSNASHGAVISCDKSPRGAFTL